MNISELSLFFKSAEQAEITENYLLDATQNFEFLKNLLMVQQDIQNQKIDDLKSEIISLKAQLDYQQDIHIKKIDHLYSYFLKNMDLEQISYQIIQFLQQDQLEKSKLKQAEIKENKAVWIDQSTNLMWSRICLGQKWENQQCSGHAKQISWNQANKLCKEFNLENFNDWRLPTEKELKTLFKMNRLGTLQNVLFMPQKNIKWNFWSNTAYESNLKGYVYVVDFEKNASIHQTKTYNKYLVRLVRNV